MLWAKTLRFYAKQGSSCIGQVEVKANTLKWATKKLFQLHLRKYTLSTQNDLQSWKQRQHQLPTPFNKMLFFLVIKSAFSNIYIIIIQSKKQWFLCFIYHKTILVEAAEYW